MLKDSLYFREALMSLPREGRALRPAARCLLGSVDCRSRDSLLKPIILRGLTPSFDHADNRAR